ncbi:MAG: hypothetical protein ACR2GL_02435 [Thermoleophilaceae bacterium]
MWATYAAATLILVASAAVGAATLRLARRDPWLGYGPAVGFALLMSVAAITIRLPGRAVTSSIAIGVLALAGAAYAAPTLRGRRPRAAALLALTATLLVMAIPFAVAGNVGVLGVGVNNDMATHLAWADGLKVAPEERGIPISPGYPIGPHAVMAAASETIGIGVADASAAVTLLIGVLALAAAWSLLAGLPDTRRGVGATLVALPYLGAAYYAQGAFKETLQTLLLLAFVAVLREALSARSADRGAALLATILAAGFLHNYSYVGLVWPLATAAVAVGLLVVLHRWRPDPLPAARGALARLRGSPRHAAGAAAVVLLALALMGPELARAISFFRTVGVSPSATGVIGTTDLGNLPGQIPVLTALGVWPAEDFRAYFLDLGNAYRAGLGSAVALTATLAAAWWWRRRDDVAIPAAALTAAAIYAAVRLRDESPYIAAKALAVGAPLAMLFTVRALLARWETDAGGTRLAHTGLALAFVLLAAGSTFVALRSARVGPEDRHDELVSLRPLVDDRAVVMLPYDDFARWELPRTQLSGPVLGVAGAGVRPEKAAGPGEPGDFDVLKPALLDQADFVISTTSTNRSEPPPNFSLEKRGRFDELWRRGGPTPERRVLAGEGSASGAVLDCGSEPGRALARRSGWARLAPQPIVARPEGSARADAGVAPGATRRFSALAGPGTYEVSMDYVALRDGELRGPGTTAPFVATLDRLGNRWRIATVRHSGGRLWLEASAPGLPFGAGAQQTGIRELSVVRVDAERELVPLREACGRYVDWYTLGARRPAVPARG